MTTDQQVQKQLNDEYDKFYEQVYKGSVAIPANAIMLFKRGIRALPAWGHKINFHKVKSIASKKLNELTIGDLHEIVKVTLSTPLEKLYPGMDESQESFLSVVNDYIKMEKFVIEYNQIIDNFKMELEQKRVTLQSLSGGLGRNGMHIIN